MWAKPDARSFAGKSCSTLKGWFEGTPKGPKFWGPMLTHRCLFFWNLPPPPPAVCGGFPFWFPFSPNPQKGTHKRPARSQAGGPRRGALVVFWSWSPCYGWFCRGAKSETTQHVSFSTEKTQWWPLIGDGAKEKIEQHDSTSIITLD